jgi:hypothetical protein
MNQTELTFIQEALVEKVNKILTTIVDNANAQVKKEKVEKTTTKKGETK